MYFLCLTSSSLFCSEFVGCHQTVWGSGQMWGYSKQATLSMRQSTYRGRCSLVYNSYKIWWGMDFLIEEKNYVKSSIDITSCWVQFVGVTQCIFSSSCCLNLVEQEKRKVIWDEY